MADEYEVPSKTDLLKRLQTRLTGLTDEELDVENLRQRLLPASPPVHEHDAKLVLIDAFDPPGPELDPPPPKPPVLVADMDPSDPPHPA
jgi:hypothetical protein